MRAPGAFAKRRKLMEDATGRSDGRCPWKGKRAANMAVKHVDTICDGIRRATTMRLREVYSTVAPSTVVKLQEMEHGMKASLITEYQYKFSFWQHIPHKCTGAFAAYVGFTQETSRKCMQECIAEYDTIADHNQIHRVAHLILNPTGTVGQQLRVFAADATTSLHDFPEAFACIRDYAFIPLNEQPVEVSIVDPVVSLCRKESCYPRLERFGEPRLSPPPAGVG